MPANQVLVQADEAKYTDYPRFLRLLGQLEQDQGTLAAEQRWHLRFLQAWQQSYAGNYARAAQQLRAVIEGAKDPAIRVRATALLISGLTLQHKYPEAYSLANGLMAELPRITDTQARLDALTQISQMLVSVGQSDVAIQYARAIKESAKSGRAECLADYAEIEALLGSGRLASSSPEFKQGINTCLVAGQMAVAGALRIDQASLMTDEGRFDLAIASLQSITPSIRTSNYQFQLAALNANLANAYLLRGNMAEARHAALLALNATDSRAFTWPRRMAYEVLYKVEKKAGHVADAFAYYEKFVAQEKAAMDDTKARALAYQMVKQEVLAKKLRLDTLSKENRILHLRQELEHKSAETARLYVALLLVLVGVIGVWLYRLKHSQLHFRRMARHDGLTGAFNRHHFMEEAGRVLARLQKVAAPACLVVLDLDHFKSVNDTYGHVAGDEVLRQAAQAVRSELRASDVFGRLGGEEFGILMPGCAPELGMEIADRVRIALADAIIELQGRPEIAVSASLGLACTGLCGYDLRGLLSHADIALYQAKREGRNRVVAARREAAALAG